MSSPNWNFDGRVRLGFADSESASHYKVRSGDDSVIHEGERNSADIEGYEIHFRKSRGTPAARADVVDGDYMGRMRGFARATTFWETASLKFRVQGAVVAAQRPGSKIEFRTNAPNTAIVIAGVIDNAQRWGVNTESPVENLTVSNSLATDAIIGVERAVSSSAQPNFRFRKARGTIAAPTLVSNGDNLGRFNWFAHAGSAGYLETARIECFVDAATADGQRPATRMSFFTNANNAAPVEALQIDANQELGVGTIPDTGRRLYVKGSTAGKSQILLENAAGGATAHVLMVRGGDNATTGSDLISFARPDGTKIGDVDQDSATTVAYNTSSDARRKTNIKPAGSALALLQSLQVRDFTWRSGGARVPFGLVAQEVHPIYPNAVSPGGDDEKTDPWLMDHSKFVPLLIRAIQEMNGA